MLISLGRGAREYTASTSSSSLTESGAQEVVNVLLSPDGNYVQVKPCTKPQTLIIYEQDVLLGEVAVIIEAWSRQAIADSISDFERTPMGRVASSTLSFQKSLADQLGLASMFVPAL